MSGDRSGARGLTGWSLTCATIGVIGGMLALFAPLSIPGHAPSLVAIFALLALALAATAIGLAITSVVRTHTQLLPGLVGVALGLTAIGLVGLAIVTSHHSMAA